MQRQSEQGQSEQGQSKEAERQGRNRVRTGRVSKGRTGPEQSGQGQGVVEWAGMVSAGTKQDRGRVSWDTETRTLSPMDCSKSTS